MGFIRPFGHSNFYYRMKRGLRKLLSFFPEFVQEFVEMIFNGAAEYHIKNSKLGKQRYRSYTQLKRRQKMMRLYISLFFLIAFSILSGILVAPIFFPQPAESEVYIPNGKGDILVGNVSRNQATVIFKTLDGANGNRPLATKSTVEFYEDEQYKDLTRRINENDYAVTHIVPVDSLQEGKIYYIRILAEDSATPVHSKVITSWGNGTDPIKVFTTGELIPTCAVQNSQEKTQIAQQSENVEIQNSENLPDNAEQKASALRIENVLNENHLQPGNKIQTIISWNTNIPASTILSYSEERSGEKKQLTISEEMTTKHAAILTTFKPGSVYYFSAQSKDASGNVATSEEYSLRTPRAQENIIQKIKNNFKGLLLQIKPR